MQDADEVAFEIIVKRHASLVMSICRRVVGQTADCDDAFQATFYALSQRPESIQECRSLSGWLYSVAWRTSIRLIRLRNKSKMETLTEQIEAPDPDPLERIAEANNLAALDEEMNQLPEKYRHVLVMSYFAHQTNQEIADQLNENKGVVDGRIREARRILRVRLARRGVEIGALLVAGSLAQSASATVPTQLITTTVQFAKLSSGFSSTVTATGVDFNQMQILSSTGTTVMGIKTVTFMTTGLLMLAGVCGFSQLMARQDAVNPGNAGAVLAAAVSDQDASTATFEPVEVDAPFAAPAKQADVPSPGGNLEGAKGVMAADGLGGLMSLAEADGLGSMQGMTVGSSEAPASGAMAEFSRARARKVQERLHSTMNSARVPSLKFSEEVALEEVLEALEASMSVEESISVRFVVDETDPDIGVDSEYLRQTMIRGISIEEGSMTLTSALDLILRKVRDQDLTWIVENEVILITTTASAESSDRAFIRSYDVKVLRPMFEEMATAVPMVSDQTGGMGGGMGGGFFMVPQASPAAMAGAPAGSGASGQQTAASGVGLPDGMTPSQPALIQNSWQRCLINEIQSLTTPPCQWLVDGSDFGTMSVVGDRLIVQQTRSGHEKVVEVLEELEQAVEPHENM